MFETTKTQMKDIKELAESIVLTEARINELQAETIDKKQQLITLMQQSGTESVKLDSGLAPKLESKQRYSKKKQIDDTALFEWLSENGLGDIIRPGVHHGTLNTALDEFSLQGGEVPDDIFNHFEQALIRFNGRSKFLASK